MGKLGAWHSFKKQRPKDSQCTLPKITINYKFNSELPRSNTSIFVQKKIFSEGTRIVLRYIQPYHCRITDLPLSTYEGICHIITMLFSDNCHCRSGIQPNRCSFGFACIVNSRKNTSQIV